MRIKTTSNQLSIWNILGAIFFAKLFSLLSFLWLKNSTELNVALIILLSRTIELMLFIWLITNSYKPMKIWINSILTRHTPNCEKYTTWKILVFICVFSAISRYFIEVIMIWLAPFFDSKAIDEIHALSNQNKVSTFRRLFLEGKTLAQITIVPLVEELVYRGVLLNYFLRHQKALVALLATSFVFAISHGNPLAAFLGGLMFGGIYLYTGRLIYCILAHATANFAIVALYLFPGNVFTFFSAVGNTLLSNVVAVLIAISWILGAGGYYLRNSWKKLESPFDVNLDRSKGYRKC